MGSVRRPEGRALIDRSVTSGTRSAPLHAVLAALPLSPHPDGELLARFIADGNQEAFAELVRRLGPSAVRGSV